MNGRHNSAQAKERGRNRVEVASLGLMLAPAKGATSVATLDAKNAA